MALIQIRIERMLISREDFPFFSDAILMVLTNIRSYHSPLLINVDKDRNNFKTPFRFESILLKYDNLEELIQIWWEVDFRGSKMFIW